MPKFAPDYPGLHAWAKARAAEEAAVKRTVYADKDGIVSRLQNERQQSQASAGLATLPRYRREFWRGKAEGLEVAIRLLQDWAGEEEPEPGATLG